MKKNLFLLFLALLCTSANAWDVIITREGGKIEGRIEEVSDAAIKYRKASNPDGPLFVIEVKDIATVIYENGDVQVFEKKQMTSENDEGQPRMNRPAYTGDKATINFIAPKMMGNGNIFYYINVKYIDDDKKSLWAGPIYYGTYASIEVPVGKVQIEWLALDGNKQQMNSYYERGLPAGPSAKGSIYTMLFRLYEGDLIKEQPLYIEIGSFQKVVNEKKFLKKAQKSKQVTPKIFYKE